MTLEELGEVQGRPWDDVDVSVDRLKCGFSRANRSRSIKKPCRALNGMRTSKAAASFTGWKVASVAHYIVTHHRARLEYEERFARFGLLRTELFLVVAV